LKAWAFRAIVHANNPFGNVQLDSQLVRYLRLFKTTARKVPYHLPLPSAPIAPLSYAK